MCLFAIDTASLQGISMKKTVLNIKAWPFLKHKKDETFKDLKAKNMKELIDRNQDSIILFFCQMALTIITTLTLSFPLKIKDKNSQASVSST